MPYKGLGKRVREQRKLAGMKQEELAEKAGISTAFVGLIERGERKASLETLVKLANALCVTPNLLLQDSLNDDLLDCSAEISDRHKKLLREISERILEYNAEDE